MGHLSRDSYFSRAIRQTFASGSRKTPSEGLISNGASSRVRRGPMATLIGERRRGTLPPVATLKYHDPAMWPVHVAARRFHPLAIRRTGPRQPLNPPCISASNSVPRRNIPLDFHSVSPALRAGRTDRPGRPEGDNDIVEHYNNPSKELSLPLAP